MRFVIILFSIFSFTSFGQKMELSWSFFHPIKQQWIDLGAKGSVQEALIANGELPDPFYGTNETKFGWIEDYDWEFKSIFFLSEELESEFVELEFPSIDTYADVYINGELVLTTDNAFIPHAVQIKKWAKKGLNELKVIFTPPVRHFKICFEEAKYQLPAPNDKHEIPIAPHSRKPQYQFGWDWALRMNTIGLNKPAIIHSYNSARVLNKTTRVISIVENVAVVEFEITLSNNQIDEIIWGSELHGKKTVQGENGRFVRTEIIKNPTLWWPRGQGEQHIYSDKIKLLESPINQSIESLELKYGIKQSELIQEEDEWGTSYYFKINGRRIFAKGANYIPQEIFPAKVEDDEVVKMVEIMAESNFNMVRVWGGGYYPDEVFYETCDRLGIMVWQDLMFACSMYPGNNNFIQNITKEFEYQVPRIAGHPSIMMFNGNNEVEVAWNNWGFQIKYGLYGRRARKIEKAYDLIFKQTAPNVIEEYSSIPYVHTSPLSNWGKNEGFNHGTQHYWGVWHGRDPIEDFGKKIGRFNAEYGFQSFPEFNTLRTFSELTDWDLSSEVMKHHQKSYVGNDAILKHAKRLYGEPADFEQFVYFSQLTQSMAVSMAVAGHRIDAPRCGGTLYWQLNDCWPAPTWSSVDYYGNWKALQYRIKEDYRDIAIVEKYDDLENRAYYLVSDIVDTFECYVVCKIYNLEGILLFEKEMSQNLNGQGSIRLDMSEIETIGLLKENALIVYQFKDHQGQHNSRVFDHIVKEYEKATTTDVGLTIDKIDPVSKTAILKVENLKFVRNLWISSDKFGIKFDRNFLTLLPGSSYISITYEEMPELCDFKIIWL